MCFVNVCLMYAIQKIGPELYTLLPIEYLCTIAYRYMHTTCMNIREIRVFLRICDSRDRREIPFSI